MISDFRHEVNEICALLGYYAAYSGNSLLMFQDNLSVLSKKVKIFTLEDVVHSGNSLLMFWDNLLVPYTGVKKAQRHRSHKSRNNTHLIKIISSVIVSHEL